MRGLLCLFCGESVNKQFDEIQRRQRYKHTVEGNHRSEPHRKHAVAEPGKNERMKKMQINAGKRQRKQNNAKNINPPVRRVGKNHILFFTVLFQFMCSP